MSVRFVVAVALSTTVAAAVSGQGFGQRPGQGSGRGSGRGASRVPTQGPSHGSAPRVMDSLPRADQLALDAIRRDVWVHWFRGDTAALRRVLGPELVAISNGSAHWQTLNESLAASVAFVRGGGTFVSVAFDSALTHRFGDAVVLFSHYTLVTERGGQSTTVHGRATEVFVKASGRWVHTSWHLDQEPRPSP